MDAHTDLVVLDGVVKLIALAPTLEDLQRIGRNLSSEPLTDHDKQLLRAVWNAKREWLNGHRQS